MVFRKVFTTLLDDRAGLADLTRKKDCWCYNCVKDVKDPLGFPVSMTRMILCPDCGNKRCPRATDHRYACTNSNDSGQPGSRY